MMDLWMIQNIAPLFYTVMELSLAAVCIGLGVLLLRKLADKRIPPIWKNALWLLVLVALVVPYRPSSNVAVIPSAEVNFRQQETILTTEITQEKTELDGVYQVPSELTQQREELHAKSLIFEVLIPAIWLLGMVGMMGILLATRQKMLRGMKTTGHHPLLDDCKHQLNITQSVEIMEQSYLKSPALYGLFHPKILLPDYVAEMSEDSQKYILLHELSHLKHHDLWKNTLLLALQIVYWFNPLVWVLFRFIRQDMELLNDQRVLKTLEKSEETPYAMSLIEVLGHSNKLPLAPQMLCMVDNKDNTKRRIQMIQLGEVFKKHKIIIAVGCLAVIAVLSALFLTQQPETPPIETNENDTLRELLAQPETPPTETPDITEVKKVIHTLLADVTHDGIDDVIVTSITILSDMQDKPLEALLNMTTLLCDIAVYDLTLSHGEPIYQRSYGVPHTGNGQLSLVEIDGLSYLLEGSLYAGQGYYTFAHSIFSLDSQGDRQVKAEDSTEGQMSDGDAASKINTYFSNLTPWIEGATAIAILDINLENQMVSTEDETYLATDYYTAMSAYYSEMTGEYAILSTPQPLPADQLSYFNDTYFNGTTGQNLNLANQFLHNPFDLPINIDLSMLFYHGAGADYAMSEDGEYDAVAQAYGFDSWAEIPTDVTAIPAQSMDDMLEQYTGIDLFATNKIGLDQFKYLEEYDCYYNLHGDTNYYGDVEFVLGTQTGDRIALSYYNSWQQADYILTLVDYGGGDYKIYSNLPAIIEE